ncbi:SCO family protein [Aliihoeflea aestuarii]|jgi:protein SCO1|uniref:SCO family protein n=1 Tax=Aliihoeflea aestuarii TaxID=453840 RepID=UPI0025B3E24C|nr:SCO family protein [Aliihoeflea aestuarii]MCO6392264.1 SCO family protein [Aliihoeflea aestuarii]
MRILVLASVIVVAAVVGWVSFDWYSSRNAGQAFGDPFALVDQRGEEITEAAFRGQPSAVFFGFTYCPEICPTTLYELDGWLDQMGSEGEDIRAYFVTVDPERDTPEIMNAYVGNVSDRITGITGEPAKIEAMAKSFGIYMKKVELEGGDYTMDHTASIILLDSAGDFLGTIAYGESPEMALAKLKRLANS